ncbi:MAG: hypothetical protein AAB225_17790, partial [Acidobacteriota bacterium]
PGFAAGSTYEAKLDKSDVRVRRWLRRPQPANEHASGQQERAIGASGVSCGLLAGYAPVRIPRPWRARRLGADLQMGSS